jgi:hypothetical protein
MSTDLASVLPSLYTFVNSHTGRNTITGPLSYPTSSLTLTSINPPKILEHGLTWTYNCLLNTCQRIPLILPHLRKPSCRHQIRRLLQSARISIQKDATGSPATIFTFVKIVIARITLRYIALISTSHSAWCS